MVWETDFIFRDILNNDVVNWKTLTLKSRDDTGDIFSLTFTFYFLKLKL